MFNKTTKNKVRTLTISPDVTNEELSAFIQDYISRYVKNGKAKRPKEIRCNNLTAVSMLKADNRIDCEVYYVSDNCCVIPTDNAFEEESTSISEGEYESIKKSAENMKNGIVSEPVNMQDISSFPVSGDEPSCTISIAQDDEMASERVQKEIEIANEILQNNSEVDYVIVGGVVTSRIKSNETPEIPERQSIIAQRFVDIYGSKDQFDVLELVIVKTADSDALRNGIIDSKNSNGTYNIYMEDNDETLQFVNSTYITKREV